MSKTLTFISGNSIEESEFWNEIISLGGDKQQIGETYFQGIVSRGESAVWLFYRGNDLSDFDENELTILLEEYSLVPKTSFSIDISYGIGSEQLAFNISKYFLERYKESVVDDSFGNYFNYEEMEKVQCKDDGSWI